MMGNGRRRHSSCSWDWTRNHHWNGSKSPATRWDAINTHSHSVAEQQCSREEEKRRRAGQVTSRPRLRDQNEVNEWFCTGRGTRDDLHYTKTSCGRCCQMSLLANQHERRRRRRRRSRRVSGGGEFSRALIGTLIPLAHWWPLRR